MRGQTTWIVVWRTFQIGGGKGVWEREMKTGRTGERQLILRGSYGEKQAVMGCRHNRDSASGYTMLL